MEKLTRNDVGDSQANVKELYFDGYWVVKEGLTIIIPMSYLDTDKSQRKFSCFRKIAKDSIL